MFQIFLFYTSTLSLSWYHAMVRTSDVSRALQSSLCSVSKVQLRNPLFCEGTTVLHKLKVSECSRSATHRSAWVALCLCVVTLVLFSFRFMWQKLSVPFVSALSLWDLQGRNPAPETVYPCST